MDVQARDDEIFELKELIFKLCVEMDEFREKVEKPQMPPEKRSDEISEQQEQMKAFRRDLDESRRQLEVQERKIQEGERHLNRLQEEMNADRARPMPERQEGLPVDVQAGLETRFAQIEEKLQKSQRQYSQWQGDSVRDFQSVEAYLTRVHTMVTELHERGVVVNSEQAADDKIIKGSPEGRDSSGGGITRSLSSWRSCASGRTRGKNGGG